MRKGEAIFHLFYYPYKEEIYLFGSSLVSKKYLKQQISLLNNNNNI